ncbi:MAG: hypothetical protein H7837_02895 [Magnetococcus sp. MYC-9]
MTLSTLSNLLCVFFLVGAACYILFFGFRVCASTNCVILAQNPITNESFSPLLYSSYAVLILSSVIVYTAGANYNNYYYRLMNIPYMALSFPFDKILYDGGAVLASISHEWFLWGLFGSAVLSTYFVCRPFWGNLNINTLLIAVPIPIWFLLYYNVMEVSRDHAKVNYLITISTIEDERFRVQATFKNESGNSNHSVKPQDVVARLENGCYYFMLQNNGVLFLVSNPSDRIKKNKWFYSMGKFLVACVGNDKKEEFDACIREEQDRQREALKRLKDSKDFDVVLQKIVREIETIQVSTEDLQLIRHFPRDDAPPDSVCAPEKLQKKPVRQDVKKTGKNRPPTARETDCTAVPSCPSCPPCAANETVRDNTEPG